MSDPTHSVRLTDDELLLLDGQCSDKAQAEVDAARRRIGTRSADLTVPQSDLIAAILGHVAKEGCLRWTSKRIHHCPLCGRDPGYRKFKSGQRAGQNDYKNRLSINGRDLDTSFVTFEGTARLGGCTDCMDGLLPHIRSALAGIPVDAPASLLGPDSPRWKKCNNRHCTACGWTGHDGQMIQDRTLMGDGWFPSRCPECKAGGAFDRTVKSVDGFVLIEQP